MTVEAILDKIRSLQFEERRLLRRGSRDELTEHRRNMLTWYSRLRQEIEAGPLREIADLERQIQRCSDPERRKCLEWDLALTRAQRHLSRAEDRMEELLRQ